MVKKTLTILCVFMLLLASAQDFKMRRVTLDEITNSSFSEDASTEAIFLFKWQKTDFEQNDIGGWKTVTKVHERIKIIKKKGAKNVSRNINLKRDDTKEEYIDNVKIVVYYSDNGKLKSQKLDESNIRKTKNSLTQHIITFDFSKIDEGSVIDINYNIHSPFYTINDLIIQEDIPTQHFYASVTIPSSFHYKRTLQGTPKLRIKENTKETELKATTFHKYFENAIGGAFRKVLKDSVFQVTEHTTEYEISNVKALKKERFSPNLENHRWLISYQLQSTDLPREGYKDHSTSWEEVIKNIYNSKQFSEALSEHSFLKNLAKEIVNDSLSKQEIINRAFNKIKHKTTWNRKLSIYPESTLENAYTKNSGNVADINLLLVALLKECGLEAYPVLTTTKNHPVRRLPNQDVFNYVLAYVELDYEDVLLDATEKNSIPNILPERILDVDGTLIYAEYDFRNIELLPKEMSHKNSILNIEISDDGKISGRMNSSFSNIDALTFRNALSTTSKEMHKNSIMTQNDFVRIENLQIKNIESLEKPVIESYDFILSKNIDLTSNEISFSPLLFLKIDENPFKQDHRSYPINFGYKNECKKIVSIKIPEGFEVVSLPQSIKISLPEGIGYFQYQISKTSSAISLVTEFQINQFVIPTHQYLELKAFYEQRIKKESEQIVLSKIQN